MAMKFPCVNQLLVLSSGWTWFNEGVNMGNNANLPIYYIFIGESINPKNLCSNPNLYIIVEF